MSDPIPEPLRPSIKGRNLVKFFEGCRAHIYQDAAGHPTIGFGHLLNARERKQYAQGINLATAEKLLDEDLHLAGIHVNSLTPGISLAQHEFDALVSFVFNVGLGNFARSTLLKKLKAGDKAGAAEEFLRWTKATNPRTGKKQELGGLVARRAAERKMFLGESWQ